MFKSKKAQLFSLDLMLALVPLTIALGMSANAMSGVVNQMQEYSDWYSAKDRVDDAADVLIKTSGVPADWNDTLAPTVLGLAVYTESEGTEPMFMDEEKFRALNSTYDTAIPSLLGGEVSYYNLSVVGISENLTNFSTSVVNGTRADASNIYVSERLAFYEFARYMGNPIINVSRYQANSTYVCYNGSEPTFYVNFTVGAGDTADYDYWIIGYYNNTNITPRYHVKSDPLTAGKNRTDCSGFNPSIEFNGIDTVGPSPSVCGDDSIDDSTSPLVTKQRITADIIEPATGELMNTVFLNFEDPQDEANFYVVRTDKNTCDSEINSAIVGHRPARMRLEVGP